MVGRREDGVVMEQQAGAGTPNVLPQHGQHASSRETHASSDAMPRPAVVTLAAGLALLQIGLLFVTTVASAWSMVNRPTTQGVPTYSPFIAQAGQWVPNPEPPPQPVMGINYAAYVVIVVVLGLILLMIVNVLRGRSWAAYAVVGLEGALLLYGVTAGLASGNVTAPQLVVGGSLATVVAVGLLSSTSRAWYSQVTHDVRMGAAPADFPVTTASMAVLRRPTRLRDLGPLCVLASVLLALEAVHWRLHPGLLWMTVLPLVGGSLAIASMVLNRQSDDRANLGWKVGVAAGLASFTTMALTLRLAVSLVISVPFLRLWDALDYLGFTGSWSGPLGGLWIATSVVGLFVSIRSKPEVENRSSVAG
jgi:hypothetical protein